MIISSESADEVMALGKWQDCSHSPEVSRSGGEACQGWQATSNSKHNAEISESSKSKLLRAAMASPELDAIWVVIGCCSLASERAAAVSLELPATLSTWRPKVIALAIPKKEAATSLSFFRDMCDCDEGQSIIVRQCHPLTVVHLSNGQPHSHQPMQCLLGQI